MEECEAAFRQFKETLSTPITLTKLDPGETMYSYVGITKKENNVALIKDDNKIQKLVYFINRALQNPELWYPRVEMVILALVFSAYKLHPYFWAHLIIVKTDQPIKKILHHPDLVGRMVTWAIEFLEYGL